MNIFNNKTNNKIKKSNTNLCTAAADSVNCFAAYSRIHIFAYSLLICLFTCLPVIAFEDIIISSPQKITNIQIEHNDIIDVFPLVTLTNDKKILFIQPLKEGSSRFILTKNNKEKSIFSVKVETENTLVEAPEEFEVLPLDVPEGAYEYEFELDEPPEEVNG